MKLASHDLPIAGTMHALTIKPNYEFPVLTLYMFAGGEQSPLLDDRRSSTQPSDVNNSMSGKAYFIVLFVKLISWLLKKIDRR